MFFPIRDNVPNFTPPYVTVTIIIINVVVFLFELVLPPDLRTSLFYHFGIVPQRVLLHTHTSIIGFLLPFVTSTFLHGSIMHLVGNMWFLWLFGDNVEDRFGHFRYLIFYLIAGISAGIFQTIHSPSSPYPVIGASGAIAGIMGAYFIMYPFAKIKVLFLFIFIPIFFYLPAMLFLPLWFFIQIQNAFSPIGVYLHVAWWAHIGGFLIGMIMAPVFDRGYGWIIEERRRQS